jgi:hypothetical protein
MAAGIVPTRVEGGISCSETTASKAAKTQFTMAGAIDPSVA